MNRLVSFCKRKKEKNSAFLRKYSLQQMKPPPNSISPS